MNLRLAWLGPWNSRSAIATFGRFVVAELTMRGHDVTIFRTESRAALTEPALPAPGAIQWLSETPAETLGRAFDGVIANVGNHMPFHGALPEVLDRTSCLVIFHDGLIGHFAAEWACQQGGERALRMLVDGVYGKSVWLEGTPYWDDLETIAAVRPMTEWLAPMAAGIVTHTEFWKPRMQAACSGRVDVLPLAYPDVGMPLPRPLGEKVVIATIGHINSNKRADQVLLAIASDPNLRARCEYRLLGHVEGPEREHLERLAGDLGLPPPRFTGWLSDEALQAEVAEADVIACLRHPVLEAGSASLVTAMYASRPILVSRQGVYAEVPEGIVLHCAPGQEADDVAAHLRTILADPDAALAMGRRARAHAVQFHSAARYVDLLLPAVVAATEAAPAIAAARRLGKFLGRFDIGLGDPSVSRIVGNLSDMLAL